MSTRDLIRRWKRLDEPGLELLRLTQSGDGVQAHSNIVHAGESPFALTLKWRLDRDWRSRSLQIQLNIPDVRSLRIERAGDTAWRVDGKPRPDLDGCAEIDVSATPFCNALAVRSLAERDEGEFTMLYVEAGDLSVTPSRQRYERLGPRRWRYIDLGVAKGFEADLEFDADGLVTRYEWLFEALG